MFTSSSFPKKVLIPHLLLSKLRSSKMNKITIWMILISIFVILQTTSSVEDEVKTSLINFIAKLSNNNSQSGLFSGWNSSSDPCQGLWQGVICDTQYNSVRKLFLNSSNLNGELDVGLLCNVKPLADSLSALHLETNMITGGISTEIASCKQLTHLHMSKNQLSGSLPDSLAMLNNLKQLDISNNKFTGDLPADLSRISGLTVFLAQNNQLTGQIPKFDFSNFELFDVSYNKFSGPMPDVKGHIPERSFLGNPELCGDPLPKECPQSSQDKNNVKDENNDDKSKSSSNNQILMFVGYLVLGLVFLFLIMCWVYKRMKRNEKVDGVNKIASVDDTIDKQPEAASMEYKSGFSRSEISVASVDESNLVSTSLIVLPGPVVNELKFEDLLKAPAELLGRGKYGSLYRVIYENGMNLVVKRIKGWAISSDDFKVRMERLDQAKHPNVMQAVAFYCSKQEKLLVYEYQHNGSLLRLLHGTGDTGKAFEWTSRLGVAASISEALAHMHQELEHDGIAHGNLKSSNILLNNNMEPCISEYGLMVVDHNQESSLLGDLTGFSAFKEDVYGFGVILLELLTGKLVHQNGINLAEWVNSVVREEWTVEVFDRSLLSECASEETMVSLLQVALKCVDRSPEARPSMNQVAVMINTLKEEEDGSTSSLEP
ncbi:hypothetical protein FEM48_Zijuj04G0031500 [Ziziphus jujuba var. spinosa]|uniref:Protein kinase domain-containing protein n=1 Tax=Ziziphus jujuba var. spinosa TaxID=714518 RepID=A0A978VHH6_ZIZJJ|nr:hypothetical protein FEM48_Zijuj04G0031500 [Ziziphus jujuba var. spinosa]